MKLASHERRWCRALFDTILPRNSCPELPIGASDLPLEKFAEDFFRVAPRFHSIGIRLALWLLVLVLTPLVLKRPRTFAGATPEQRKRVLETLAASRIYALRELPGLFKLMASLAFFGHPDVQARIGITHRDAEPPVWAR